jgi:hypothetical protein
MARSGYSDCVARVMSAEGNDRIDALGLQVRAADIQRSI